MKSFGPLLVLIASFGCAGKPPEDAQYVGSLEMPKRMSTDGLTFSSVSGEATTEPARTNAPQGTTIRITTTAQDASKEEHEFDFTLTTAGEARFKIVEAPFEPWPFARYAGADSPHVWNALRQEFGIPTLAEQQTQMQALQGK